VRHAPRWQGTPQWPDRLAADEPIARLVVALRTDPRPAAPARGGEGSNGRRHAEGVRCAANRGRVVCAIARPAAGDSRRTGVRRAGEDEEDGAQPAGGRKTVYRTRCHAPFRATRVRRPRRERRTLPPSREQRQDKKSQRNLNHGRAEAVPWGAASRRPAAAIARQGPPRLAEGLTATDRRLRFASGFLAGGGPWRSAITTRSSSCSAS